jgi:hypothetical protein
MDSGRLGMGVMLNGGNTVDPIKMRMMEMYQSHLPQKLFKYEMHQRRYM